MATIIEVPYDLYSEVIYNDEVHIIDTMDIQVKCSENTKVAIQLVCHRKRDNRLVVIRDQKLTKIRTCE